MGKQLSQNLQKNAKLDIIAQQSTPQTSQTTQTLQTLQIPVSLNLNSVVDNLANIDWGSISKNSNANINTNDIKKNAN